jgi:hypothetical protein
LLLDFKNGIEKVCIIIIDPNLIICLLEYEKEQLIKKPKNRTTVTKRTTQTRSSFQIMMAVEPKIKRSPIHVQNSFDTDDDPDCQLLPECREAVRLEYSR